MFVKVLGVFSCHLGKILRGGGSFRGKLVPFTPPIALHCLVMSHQAAPSPSISQRSTYLGGHSITTWTKSYPILTTYCPKLTIMDILYTWSKVDSDHLYPALLVHVVIEWPIVVTPCFLCSTLYYCHMDFVFCQQKSISNISRNLIFFHCNV